MVFTNALKALEHPCYEIVNRQKRAQVGPFFSIMMIYEFLENSG